MTDAQKFENILFDNQNTIVEKSRFGRRSMTSKLYKNDVLVAKKTFQDGEVKYKFYNFE